MYQKLTSFLTARRLTVLVLVLFCAVGLQKYLLGTYNNYLMFARPFHNLLLNQSVYGLQPHLYLDNYKYSPTFAWLMGPFYYLPVWLGVLLWNALGAVALLAGLRAYCHREQWYRTALLIVVLEALITAQNMQSNNLIIGAILLGLRALETHKPVRAAFFFALCAFVKFYGGAAAILFLFYPQRVRFLAAMAGWTLLFAAAPLTLLPVSSLLSEYQAWLEVVRDSKLGQLVSILGICEAWFGMAKTDANLRIVEAVGIVLFLLPLVRYRLWSNAVYRQRMAAFFLLFVILFNKMAESPTYVLAVTGVALWWLTLEQPGWLDRVLLGLVIVFTSLSPTDLFPKALQNDFFVPYNIKAVPCALIWLRVMAQLWLQPVSRVPEPVAEPAYALD